MKNSLRYAVLLSAAVMGGVLTMPGETRADDNAYVYRAPSYYVAPPTYYPPVYAPQPYYYEPGYAAPRFDAGYYYPAPVRGHEVWTGNPWRSRYKYEVKYPGGLEYEYRYRRDGDRVRESGKWDD